MAKHVICLSNIDRKQIQKKILHSDTLEIRFTSIESNVKYLCSLFQQQLPSYESVAREKQRINILFTVLAMITDSENKIHWY